MPNTLAEKDWKLLIKRIDQGRCTPFLGAGACYGVLPLGAKIAQDWAQEYSYPLGDSCEDLARVSQFLVVEYDPIFPKGELAAVLQNVGPPDFSDASEPHGLLADLPLPIYMTTNYDNFMMRALEDRKRDPKRELCQWNDLLRQQPSILGSEHDFVPTPANPVVFHLHGYFESPESMVLTENDYLKFLVEISRSGLLPPIIEAALANTSLLFLGYRLADWNFRVIFQSIADYLGKSMQMAHISVQLMPGEENISEEKKEKVIEYLNHYFGAQNIRVFWGTCREFVTELRKRWEEFNHGK